MTTEFFYADLPPVTDLLAITDPQRFIAVPPDWYILLADLIGSTQAVAAGRYRDVNLLGAAAITAVLNAVGRLEIPFVFGGDGGVLLVPPGLLAPSRQALIATRALAEKEFGLALRVGAVPVAEVVEAGHEVKIVKLQISSGYSQANFAGGGLRYATDLIKSPQDAGRYIFGPEPQAEASFAGLECRWQDIPNPRGEILTLILMAAREGAAASLVYRLVIEKLVAIYGQETKLCPLHPAALRLSFNPSTLMAEARLQGQEYWWIHLGLMWLQNLLGWCLIQSGFSLLGLDWGKLRAANVANADYRKRDDALRLVLACTASQRQSLVDFLEDLSTKGELFYGLHRSDRAHLTCMVFDRQHHHIHFVDGADGGYVLAAQDLKRRLGR